MVNGSSAPLCFGRIPKPGHHRLGQGKLEVKAS